MRPNGHFPSAYGRPLAARLGVSPSGSTRTVRRPMPAAQLPEQLDFLFANEDLPGAPSSPVETYMSRRGRIERHVLLRDNRRIHSLLVPETTPLPHGRLSRE